MQKWKCTVCGYIHEGDEPPEKCPVCGADRSLFVLLDAEGTDEAASPISPKVEQPEGDADSRWRCTVCGYIHTGSSPPDKCPVCGADKSQFVLQTDEAADERASDATQASTTSSARDQIEDESGISRMFPDSVKELSRKLTLFHGHPIAVHIPNGVLPVSVLFAFLALLFGSSSLAAAAKWNFLLIALAMPIVIATGIIDWINRFKGRMTPVFKVKMVCAAIVTVLTIILAVWWIADPEVYSRGLFSNWFFFLLHLIDLVAAGTAGWYGGKLVFHS